LLVVVAVILVLAGITLKVSGIVARRSAYAKTVKIVEQVKHALAEYYSAYGSYPPGDKAANGYSSIEYVVPPQSLVNAYPSASGWHTSTGLVYYLVYFDKTNQWPQFTAGVVPNSGWQVETNSQYQGGTTPTYTNSVQSIMDGWEQRLNYVSSGTNSYQSYQLWSNGPNGVNEQGAGDDIGLQWSE